MRCTVCASPRNRHAHGHVTRIILFVEFAGKMPGTKIAMHSLCDPAQAKRTWTCRKNYFIRRICRKNAGDQDRDAQSVRPRAGETHMDMSQEPFYARIYRKNAGDQSAYPDLTPASTSILRTHQCEHIVWGIIPFSSIEVSQL